MIRQNPYNTSWWGEPVGDLQEVSLFSLNQSQAQAALQPFAWVEFKAPLANSPPPTLLQRHGFFLADVQVPFRIALKDIPGSPSLSQLACQSAKQEPFSISPESLRSFENERFLHIPGTTMEKLNLRYARWANQLIAQHPQWCLAVCHEGQPQGWFLSEPKARGLNLTLAMSAKDARVSGLHLFQKAIQTYWAMGASLGFASFSVQNTPVLNIYSHLGAKFLPPEGNWLWVRNDSNAPNRSAQ